MAADPKDLPSHAALDPERVGALLRSAADGDQSSWKALVGHFAPRVFGLVRAQCGDADLAEEITQSTFCTMAAKIGSYVEGGKFEAWLFRIALNRLRDEARRRSRQATPTDDTVLAAIVGSRTSDAAASSRPGSDLPEEIVALRAAIAKLSPSDQRVIHLRHAAGLGFKEIAEVLDEPLGTLLARHHRALKKLRDLMGEEGTDTR
ncbi:MAG: RNA polymerase sigma factor [Phycisphaerales bacterium]